MTMGRRWEDWKPHTDGFWDDIHPQFRQMIATMLFRWRDDVRANFTQEPPSEKVTRHAGRSIVPGRPRDGRPWEGWEDRYLTENYGRMTVKRIAYDLDRRDRLVYARAYHLKLNGSTYEEATAVPAEAEVAALPAAATTVADAGR